jgi:hypothetical protein
MELLYLVIILNVVKFCLPNGEIVTYIAPKNCSDHEFYVPSLMLCVLCDDRKKSSIDRE